MSAFHVPQFGIETMVRIAIYYGAADSYVALAFTRAEEIMDYIKEHSVLSDIDEERGKR